MNNPIDTNQLDQLATRISEAGSILICTHISPDSDAIGSAFGVASAILENLHLFKCNGQIKDKSITLYFEEPLPKRNLFNIDPQLLDKVKIIHEIANHKFDLLIATDNATLPRLGSEHEAIIKSSNFTLQIDHHISNSLYCDLNIIYADRSSTSQLIYELFNSKIFVETLSSKSNNTANSISISSGTASLLFMGIFEDTGGFKFSNTTTETFEVASKLVQLGASPAKISSGLYQNEPLNLIKLKTEVMSSLKISSNNLVGSLILTKDQLLNYNINPDQTGGFIDEIRCIEGLKAVFLMREKVSPLSSSQNHSDSSEWKVSLRSKDERLDVNKIAGTYGGGGHKMAAGCTIQGQKDVIRADLENLISEELKLIYL